MYEDIGPAEVAPAAAPTPPPPVNQPPPHSPNSPAAKTPTPPPAQPLREGDNVDLDSITKDSQQPVKHEGKRQKTIAVTKNLSLPKPIEVPADEKSEFVRVVVLTLISSLTFCPFVLIFYGLYWVLQRKELIF